MSEEDELRRLISDVNDANLYGLSQLEERIDALERRIERIDGMLDGMGKGAAARIEALEQRIEKLEQRMDGKDETDGEMLLFFGKCFCDMERKLNHKGGTE